MRKSRIFLTILLALLLLWNTAGAAVWFGDTDEHRLHRDPYCSQRQFVFREPFAYAFWFEDMENLYADGNWVVCGDCFVATDANPVVSLPDSFRLLWNASLEEKAAMLPGVWTLPSSGAVPPDVAYTAAKTYVANIPAFRQYLDSQGRCTASVLHYDACTAGAEHQYETYKVLITTTKMEPVGIVCVDAQTGDVYGAVLLAGGEADS